MTSVETVMPGTASRTRAGAVCGAKAVGGADQLGEVRAPSQIELATGQARRLDVPEPCVRGQVMPVRIDVLAEQGHLTETLGGQRPCLSHDVIERAAALRAATERHDAVGARLVAAVDGR